jgi:hypothetical protein
MTMTYPYVYVASSVFLKRLVIFNVYVYVASCVL